MSRDIEPWVYLTLEDLHPVAACQRLGEEMHLQSTALPPSSWRPSPELTCVDDCFTILPMRGRQIGTCQDACKRARKKWADVDFVETYKGCALECQLGASDAGDSTDACPYACINRLLGTSSTAPQ
jgi:hypothetical protein